MKGGSLDIETFMGHYRSYANNLYEAKIIEVEPVRLASFSYKEYGKNKFITKGVWEYETYQEFLQALWQIFDDNDFLIGQNIKKFDNRQTLSFFAREGMKSPSPVKFYDTMTIARKNFNLPSYSLKYMLVYFGIGEKIETGGDNLWLKTEQGDPTARRKFLEYNKNDTVQTEKLFDYFLKYGYTESPTAKHYVHGEGCLRCKGTSMQSRGDVPRAGGWVHGYCCLTCGKRNYTEVFKKYEGV